ncbi:nuclear transport factor 2 family protein [Zunongwangia endophytica]|uniref:Nuclear transport factor 2 family protein n=1 Tax=Zunongwangia endophytica TaxID=1808945 RepID=A0ABV8H731_9FLAO|nr:nuclear transport factor 2 family protein [Zunongwangia endophytica]MDN3595702.1 nuclear transport factor 2 family protein [Zunongwangia endophytica]
MKQTILFISFCFISIIGSSQTMPYQSNKKEATSEINKVIDSWHEAAAEANFQQYFSLLTKDAIFIGTDPTENWNKDEFKAYSKPHFDKGKAWSFSSVERNIYLEDNKGIAWFDELLDTHMGICRGSGVMRFENGNWKIAHYVLSIEIPNDNVTEVVDIKKDFDEKMIETIKAEQ